MKGLEYPVFAERPLKVCLDELTFVKTLAALEEYRVARSGLLVAPAGSRGSVLGRIQLLENELQMKLLNLQLEYETE